MEVKHYNAIAKILGGNLLGDSKLEMLINSLSKYFESEDDAFNKHEFRAACLNGHSMEGTYENDIEPILEEISPKTVEKTPYTWKPKESSVGERIHDDWKIAMANMHNIVGKNFKKGARNGKKEK